MIEKNILRKVITLQNNEILERPLGVKRELLSKISLLTNHILVISGIRRCGKSTLLLQLMKKVKKPYYFNFEDYRVMGFEINDFEKLDDLFEELYEDSTYYFYDEIQNVSEWERYIRTKHDYNKICIITGSNASLLSRELGTKLTGRHLTYELFPFSYSEYLVFFKKKLSFESFNDYFNDGGFPDFLKQSDKAILQEIVKDIVMKDVIVRHKIRESKTVEELLIYLLSNISKEFSYNELAKTFNVGSATSIINYISYFEDCYLLFTVPRFSFSIKKQRVNPKKIYAIDQGLVKANSVSFSTDNGRILENIVFLHLRRYYKDIFYFKEKNECDFIIKEKEKPISAIQVCYEINNDNMLREINGLKEAMSQLNIKNGLIITLNQEDKLGGIKLIPVWKWLCNPFFC
ncbi:MAG: ATP-binding protein [Candidatus Woesearchaeota archaeon]